MVDIIKGKTVKGFKEEVPVIQRVFLRTWVQSSGKGKKAEDLISTEPGFLSPCLPVPEFIKLQFFVQSLDDAVADVSGVFGAGFKLFSGIYRDRMQSFRIRFFCQLLRIRGKVGYRIVILLEQLAHMSDAFHGPFTRYLPFSVIVFLHD